MAREVYLRRLAFTFMAGDACKLVVFFDLMRKSLKSFFRGAYRNRIRRLGRGQLRRQLVALLQTTSRGSDDRDEKDQGLNRCFCC